MKLFEVKSDYSINNEHGTLRAHWKRDLDDEEGEGYLPEGYNKILELESIISKKLGEGHGDALMKEFLSSSIAKEAELIFLDPNPGLGLFAGLKLSEEDQVKKLIRFYKKYGFQNNPRSHRMWLVKKGKIMKNNLPT